MNTKAQLSRKRRRAVPVRVAGPALFTVFALAAGSSAEEPRRDPGGSSSLGDVHSKVAIIRSELELLRVEMGRPKNKQPEINVRNAATREVYFQALTLFRKANRMCVEQTREETEAPDSPRGEIGASDLASVLDAALERVQRVKKELGIHEPATASDAGEAVTPTDVLRSIVQANRQLNLLLEREFSPSDVFQQVTLAVGYCAKLLAHFPEAQRIPGAPAWERGKRPADVYGRLVACFRRIREIAELSGLDMLTLETNEATIESATPSDVYDIASLVVSELTFLHSQIDGAERPHDVYYPGRKFPSHVYQRAGILEKQLIELQALAEKDPGWMERKREAGR